MASLTVWTVHKPIRTEIANMLLQKFALKTGYYKKKFRPMKCETEKKHAYVQLQSNLNLS